MTNITIQLTPLRDGKTWRAIAEATGRKPVSWQCEGDPGKAAHIATHVLIALASKS